MEKFEIHTITDESGLVLTAYAFYKGKFMDSREIHGNCKDEIEGEISAFAEKIAADIDIEIKNSYNGVRHTFLVCHKEKGIDSPSDSDWMDSVAVKSGEDETYIISNNDTEDDPQIILTTTEDVVKSLCCKKVLYCAGKIRNARESCTISEFIPSEIKRREEVVSAKFAEIQPDTEEDALCAIRECGLVPKSIETSSDGRFLVVVYNSDAFQSIIKLYPKY